jgi:hypothetical protein
VQVNDVGITNVHKIRMVPLSLIGAAFNWFTSLPLNSIDSWVSIGAHKMLISCTSISSECMK